MVKEKQLVGCTYLQAEHSHWLSVLVEQGEDLPEQHTELDAQAISTPSNPIVVACTCHCAADEDS